VRAAWRKRGKCRWTLRSNLQRLNVDLRLMTLSKARFITPTLPTLRKDYSYALLAGRFR
jgi:hypothetical protein